MGIVASEPALVFIRLIVRIVALIVATMTLNDQLKGQMDTHPPYVLNTTISLLNKSSSSDSYGYPWNLLLLYFHESSV